MAFLFIGGELEDFTNVGSVTFDTSTIYNRSAYSRGAVYMQGGNTNFAKASFTAASSIWLTFRLYTLLTSTTTYPVVVLTSGGNARLQFRWTAGSVWQLEKFDGTTTTVLATATGGPTMGTTGSPAKFDIQVIYGTSGTVKVYGDQVLYLTYTGDTTAGGATTLDGVTFQNPSGGTTTGTRHVYSEIIVADQDTRPLSVKTLAPNAAGDVTAWTSGAYTDIDETTASDTDLLISETANQVLTVNCTGMPTGGSGLSVRAVKSVAYACRGGSGPSKLALGVRQSSTNSFATAVTLDTGYGAVSQTWTTNPVTSAVFTSTEIDNLQLAYRSET